MHPLPRILDVVRAAKQIAPAHPDVIAWWYAPPRRLAVSGAPTIRRTAGPAVGAEEVAAIEIAVESPPAASPDRVRIARELSEALHVAAVSVRAYRGAAEERTLFRLVSR